MDRALPAQSRSAPTIVIDSNRSFGVVNLREIWDYRELLYLLVWRQVIVKYKQTVVGIAWAVVQPLVSMIVMTLVFNGFLNVSSGEIPYPIFALSGLIFWRYFSSAVTVGGQSLVSNAQMISKVYFPRIIVLIAGCLAPLVDFLIGFGVLLLALPLFGVVPSLRLVLAPVLLLATLATALSVTLWLSALHVRYRDIGSIIPFLIQIWMYLVPIMYPIERVSEAVRPIYSINPMVGVVEGGRWVLLDQGTPPDLITMGIGLLTVFVLLTGGFFFFHRTERSFADVV
ncbi:MAG: ABC transporter permease [Chloroflexi bacterium]|nr:ABC transporter permease [Chloroflexota bacterium]